MSPRWTFWLGLAFALLATACGGTRTRRVVVPPEYSADYAVTFDDTLAPALFGFDPEGRDPTRDPKLRARVLRADIVLPVRVETVSRQGGVENRGAYHVILAGTGPALYGEAPADSLELTVSATNPTYPWIDGAGPRWVGTRLLLFGKRFKTDAGEVLHYRGEPDTPSMREAVDRLLRRRVLRI